MCSTSLVMLKAASILGEEFEFKALKHINPFPKKANSDKIVSESIKLLEQKDFIQIVNETDAKNVVCRFNKAFLRESVYQILLYKSCKKDLHTATQSYLQKMSLSRNPLKAEAHIQTMRKHMLQS